MDSVFDLTAEEHKADFFAAVEKEVERRLALKDSWDTLKEKCDTAYRSFRYVHSS